MDLDEIRTFVTIARERSFSGAAGKLGRSQPAISRRIELLESELGAKLFERLRAGAVLTDAGSALLPYAEAMLANAKDGAASVRDVQAGDTGTISSVLSWAEGQCPQSGIALLPARLCSSLLMGSWPREERRYNGCGIQQQPLGFGLQLGSPPHDAVSIRAKPKRPRDAAHFFSRCALLFCQSAEISLRHEANNSAEGLKAPTVCNCSKINAPCSRRLGAVRE
jgi:molybdenum-dependent DNA-binding transcriptional regulator ModE